MGVLETFARVVQLGGTPMRAEKVAQLRTSFERRTGAFAPEDEWFEERSRAFWSDTVTRERFGREIEGELQADEREWLIALESAHRGLFRAERRLLVDVWSGVELLVTVADEASSAELASATGQLFDGRVVAGGHPLVVALLPGSVFHPRDAAAAIAPVLAAARSRELSTHDALDALLRMERSLRSLPRGKAAFSYRTEGLSPRPPSPPVRRALKAPK